MNKNKSFFTFLLLITLFLSSRSFVLAQDTQRPVYSTDPYEMENRPSEHDTFRKRVESSRERFRTASEKRQSELETRLTKFSDQQKAAIVQRVSENLNTINKNRVNAMTSQLETIEAILTRVKTKTAEEKANGTNVASIESAITQAETAIATAKTAVTTQAGKDYTITVTDEAKMRAEMKAKRDLLFNDLKAVHEKVKLAREKTRSAIKSANAITPTQSL